MTGLQELGLSTIVIDSGILGEPLEIVQDIPHEQSATYAGSNLETMRTAGSRGKAVDLMRESLKESRIGIVPHWTAGCDREYGRC